MDLIALYQVVARHKLAVAAVVLATMAGIGYVMFGVPDTYKQTSGVVLLQPRNVPSKADIKKNPSLANKDNFNPFGADPRLILEAVAARVSTDKARAAFEEKGLDPTFQVSPAVDYGTARPVLNLTSFGASAEQTSDTRKALTKAVQDQLAAIQKEAGVASYYMLGSLGIDPLSPPKVEDAGSMRSVLAVVAAGGVVLFGLLSLLTAVDQFREGREYGEIPTRRRRRRFSAEAPALAEPPAERAPISAGKPAAASTPAGPAALSSATPSPAPAARPAALTRKPAAATTSATPALTRANPGRAVATGGQAALTRGAPAPAKPGIPPSSRRNPAAAPPPPPPRRPQLPRASAPPPPARRRRDAVEEIDLSRIDAYLPPAIESAPSREPEPPTTDNVNDQGEPRETRSLVIAD